MPAKRQSPRRIPTRRFLINMACQTCGATWKAVGPEWYINLATSQEHPCVAANHKVVRLFEAEVIP